MASLDRFRNGQVALAGGHAWSPWMSTARSECLQVAGCVQAAECFQVAECLMKEAVIALTQQVHSDGPEE